MKNIRKYIYIITIIIFIIFCIMVIIRKRELKDNNVNYKVNKEKDIIVNNDKINDEEEYIYVDIKGEVINPNVYKIKKGLRVIDVINLAGGLTEESDTSNINLSKIVTDEMVIVIKSKNNEEVYIDSDVDINNNNNNNQLIDINTCTIDELLTLPGIGESKANNIIEYRKKNKFNTINDIMNVSGISESLFNKIKEYIKV